MAIDIPLELDSGPITWVKAEIESALFRALEGIEQLRAAPSVELRDAIRTELHQVSGALELVGIEGLSILVQEFEKHFASDVEVVAPEALDLVDRGCRRLLSHLKEMVSGSPPIPLRFISEYLSLGKLRQSKFGPADLFFPDLSRRPAKLSTSNPPEPSRMPAFLLRQRRDFQHGLLQWLRGSEMGLEQMCRAIAEIEGAYPLPSQRSFWWSTRALLEATRGGFVDPSTALKQLMARVDLQVRRFVEGSTRVADRLRREVLYHVARSRNGNPLVDEVKALYELDVLVPKRVPKEIDIVALRPAIAHLSEIVTRCKNAWTSHNSGRTSALQKLREAASELPAACDALQMPDFSSLGKGIASATSSAVDTKHVGDDLSIELATSLILIETAIEHIAALPSSFRTQVERAVQRLSYAMSNAPIPPELRAETEANSLTRLAQEKQTVSQVVREIRTNMRHVEQALDAVFRDRAAIDEMKPVPALLGQVSGAMRMLGWNDANELLSKTTDRLIESVRKDAVLSSQEIDTLADVLAGLSFYVDVRERRERDADVVLTGLKRRFFGETGTASEGHDEEDSVEASLAERQRMLRPLTRAVNDAPERIELRESLRSTLHGVRRDAELLSDSNLSKASIEALRLLDGDAAQPDALTAAVAAVVGTVAELPPTSAEMARLVESEPDERDTGLLDIFVEEAIEVVQSVRLAHQTLSLEHDRRDLLIELRRSFHTLKGSGRMVGQTRLADVAWRVEGVLNKALETERGISESELALIGKAVQYFSGWVDALRDNHEASIDVSILDEWVARCSSPSAPAAAITIDSANSPASYPIGRVLPMSAIAAAGVAEAAQHTQNLATDGADLDAQLAHAVDSLHEIWRTEPHADLPTLGIDGAINISPTTVAALDDKSMVTAFDDQHFNDAATNALDASSDEMRILGVSVSRALFSILTDETRVHLQTLDYELALMQFDPSLPPSDPTVRAAHTLCGIHRTAGFFEIGDFAGLLESVLMAIRRSGHPSSAIGIIASAIRSLRTATLRLQSQSPLAPEEQTDLDRSRAQLHAIVAETGSGDFGVEVELLEQTHAEERALATENVPSPSATTFIDQGSFADPILTQLNESRSSISSVSTVAKPFVVEGPEPAVEAAVIVLTAPASVAAASPFVEPFLAPSAALAPLPTAFDLSPPSVPSMPPTIDSFQPRDAQPIPVVVPPVAATPVIVAAAVSASAATLLAAQIGMALGGQGNPTAVVSPAEMTTLRHSEGDLLADIRDDIDEQVLPIFLEEAQELFPRASGHVTAWRHDSKNPAHSDDLKRALHTLKGSARMAGAMRLGEVAHMLETRLTEVAEIPTSIVFDDFDEYLDDIAFLLERLTHNEKDSVLPRYAVAAPNADPSAIAVFAELADDESADRKSVV